MGMTNADFAMLFRKESRSAEPPGGMTDESMQAGDTDAFSMNPMMQAAMRRNAEDDETWEDDTPPPPSFTASTTEPEESREPSKQPKTARDDKRVLSEAELRRKFTWEKHTTGFGLKMMAKMGFSGRLGKDEKGVSATVEVVQRPNQMGLGFGSFKEAGNLKHNKRLEKELKGETFDEQEERERETRETEALQEDDSLWRKRKVPSGGRVHKMASEVSHQAHSKKPRNEIILDMRGPDVRVLDQLTDAYADTKLEDAKPKLGEELIYNVRMVVNLAQGRIYDLTQKIDTNTATVESMKKEAKMLTAQVDTDSLRWAQVSKLLQDLENLKALSEDAKDTLAIDQILQALRNIRSHYKREFEAYRIIQVVPSLVIAPLKTLLLATAMLDENMRHSVLDVFRQVQLFLLESSTPTDAESSEVGSGVFQHIREKSNPVGEDIYNYILEETLWPAAVQMVNSQWKLQQDPVACAAWYEAFRPHLSNEFASAFLHDLVLPRLKKECQRWNPASDSTFMHHWLQPWFVHMESALETLNEDIQQSLGNALAQWHPSDLSVLPVIRPWREVWGETEFGKFTHRHIVRKLIRCLHREFEVDPQNQSLDVLRWVLAWQRDLPDRQLVALIEGEFFPKWLKVLRHWVSESPEFAELETWYVGWKKFFTKHNLATEPRLVVHFHGALILLETALVRDTDPLHEIPHLNRLAPTSFQEALVAASGTMPPDQDRQRQPPSEAPRSRRPSHTVNLKDLVEHTALENGLDFMPKGLHNGHQVYVFGKHQILIDQGVVYVQKSKGDFQPVDIQQLVHS